jgi:hypothetical protein
MGLFSAFAFHAAPGTGGDEGLSLEEREAAALYEQLTGEPIDWAGLRSFNARDRLPAQFEKLIPALAAQPDSASRRVLTERFFRVVGPHKIAALVQELAPEARQTPDVFQALLASWKAHDPAAANGFLNAMIANGDAPPEWREGF